MKLPQPYQLSEYFVKQAGLLQGVKNIGSAIKGGWQGAKTLGTAERTLATVGNAAKSGDLAADALVQGANNAKRLVNGVSQAQKGIYRPARAFGSGAAKVWSPTQNMQFFAKRPWLAATAGRALTAGGIAGGYGVGNAQGQQEGASQVISKFETMPWYQSMLYGLPNVYGHRQSMRTKALKEAQGKLNGTWKGTLANLLGANYDAVNARVNELNNIPKS